jgi:SAM-dependent methyltransferase
VITVIANITSFPLRMAEADDLSPIRSFFRDAGYDDATLCRVLGLVNMSAFGRVDWDKIELEKFPPALRWCLSVFARGLPTETRLAGEICGEALLNALLTTGLLRPAKNPLSALVCPVWLYPVESFVVASDRGNDPDGGTFTPAADVVFPAIYAGTLRFLQLLPEVHGGDALDLCGGSGIGALHLSGTARVSITADLAERSAQFAEFNARLNGVGVESVCGDLYDPVRGRQFDLISAHPPFVPATKQTMVYRDGGETGESVTRRIIEGLPDHLRPGGTAVVLCVACDWEQKTFEQRAREWLGATGDEFDLLFGLEKVLSVEEIVESIRKRGEQIGEEEAQQLHARLRQAGTRQFVYGALFVRRYAQRVTEAPARVNLTLEGRAQDFERLLDWRHFCRQPAFSDWLASSRPRLAAELGLTARHVVQDGELVPAEFVFSIAKGFVAALRPDPWVVPLVARLNGGKSVQEVFEAARSADELPAGFTVEAFLGLVQRMIELGLLVAPEWTAYKARPIRP